MHLSERIMNIFQYIFWFFILNLFTLLIGGIPFLLFYLGYGLDGIFTYFPIFILSLVPLGPAFVALHFSMTKFIIHKDIHLLHDFWRTYRKEFWFTLRISLFLALIAIFIGYDFAFLELLPFGLIFLPLLVVSSLFLVLVIPYLFTVISRYKLPFWQTFKLAFTMMFNHPLTTAFHFVFLLFILILFDFIAGYASAFVFALWAFMHMRIHIPLLEQMEEKKFI